MSFTGWGRISRRTKWHYFVRGKAACHAKALAAVKDIETLLLKYHGTGIKDGTIDQYSTCKECYRLKMGVVK